MAESIYKPYIRNLEKAKEAVPEKIKPLMTQVREEIFDRLEFYAEQVETAVKAQELDGQFSPLVSARMTSLEMTEQVIYDQVKKAVKRVLQVHEDILSRPEAASLENFGFVLSHLWIKAQKDLESGSIQIANALGEFIKYLELKKNSKVGNRSPNLN